MPDHSRIFKKLEEIHSEIEANYLNEKNIGGLSGKAGLALFEFYYSQLMDDDQYAELGMEIISSALDDLNAGYRIPTYCAGMAGFGWIIDHLIQAEFLDDSVNEIFAQIDDYIFQNMEAALAAGLLDFLHGATGYAFYFLQRYQRAQSAADKAQYLPYLNSYLKALDELAEKEQATIKWKLFVDPSLKTEGYELSLAHGQSSIINILTRLTTVPDLKSQALRLLKGSLAFLNQHCNRNVKNEASYFPGMVKSEPLVENKTRVAWCYGDLGIGLTLRKAGSTIGDESLMELAQEILEYVSQKRELKVTGVRDAGFCHGAFGLAHIYLQLHRETALPAFQQTADFWLDEGLKKATFKEGYAGFKQWIPEQQGWQKRLNVLEGIAGIGLSLINYLDAEKSAQWDECFLLS